MAFAICQSELVSPSTWHSYQAKRILLKYYETKGKYLNENWNVSDAAKCLILYKQGQVQKITHPRPLEVCIVGTPL